MTNRNRMHHVRLTGWRKGALAVSAIEILKQSGRPLSGSKAMVERCLAGEISVVDCASLTTAQEVSTRLGQIGFLTEIIHPESGEVVSQSP